MRIYGELTGQYKISVADGVTVILDGVVITNGVNDKSYSWAGINCLGNGLSDARPWFQALLLTNNREEPIVSFTI